ncbi:MAG: hypothetical protein J7518_06200 [Nocardioidaceae bacterium]|nr:hypothetical protein [Nocardioidaceae bacterium]
MRLSVLIVLLAALAAGCGDADTPATQPDGPCLGDLPVLRSIKADLDGNGTDEDVQLTGPRGECGAALRVVADRSFALVLAGGYDPVPDSLRDLGVGHGDSHVFLLRSDHPRGGFEVRLFAITPGRVDELTIDGKPVIPFLAADAPTEHVSADCTRHGFTVTEAVAHQPVGIVAAWDVYRTAYEVDGNYLTRGDRTEVADNVLEDELPAKYPDVVENRLFPGC